MGKKTTTTKGKRAKPVEVDTLPPQQLKFCEAYVLNGGNGAEAYFKAYPASRKHTPQYRAEKASKLLAEVKIKAKISQISPVVEKVLEEKFEISAEKVLQEIANIAYANLGDYLEWGTRKVPRTHNKTGEIIRDDDGNAVYDFEPFNYIKPSNELTAKQRAVVIGASISYSKDGSPSLELKMAPKLDALKVLGTHLKLFKEAAAGAQVNVGAGATVNLMVSQAEAAL